jgi:aryl-alcohol dehydrogenase-like predicted oxidoreductase
MIILNPFEPWPGSLVLPAAKQYEIDLITRVVDYGGIFHDDVKPGHQFAAQDHRAFRPAGWVEAGNEKLSQLRPFCEKHGVTMLQLACLWNLSQAPIKSVIPTLMQEIAPARKTIESKVDELAALPEITLSSEDIERIAYIGNNKGCMQLKGANQSHVTPPEPDKWNLSPELGTIAKRWGIDPEVDLAYAHAEQKTA